MIFFFEVPDESPALSSDVCVDEGSVLEDVIAGKRVAAAAVIAIKILADHSCINSTEKTYY
jgi:hypothetical protein